MNKQKKINQLFSLWVSIGSPKGFFILLPLFFNYYPLLCCCFRQRIEKKKSRVKKIMQLPLFSFLFHLLIAFYIPIHSIQAQTTINNYQLSSNLVADPYSIFNEGTYDLKYSFLNDSMLIYSSQLFPNSYSFNSRHDTTGIHSLAIFKVGINNSSPPIMKSIKVNVDSPAIYFIKRSVIIADKKNRVYLVSYIYSKTTKDGVMTNITRLDTGYNVVWSKSFKRIGVSVHRSADLFVNDDMILTGSDKDSILIMKMDTLGNLTKAAKFRTLGEYGIYIFKNKVYILENNGFGTNLRIYNSRLAMLDSNLNMVKTVGTNAGLFYYFTNQTNSNLKQDFIVFTNWAQAQMLKSSLDTMFVFRLKNWITYGLLNVTRSDEQFFSGINLRNDRSIEFSLNTYENNTLTGLNTLGRHYFRLNPDWKTMSKNVKKVFPITFRDYPMHHPMGLFITNNNTFSAVSYNSKDNNNFIAHIHNKNIDIDEVNDMKLNCKVESPLIAIDTYVFPAISNLNLMQTAPFSGLYSVNVSIEKTSDSLLLKNNFLNYADLGTLNAKFKLDKIYCGKPIDLHSDTTLKYGQSKWYVFNNSYVLIDSFTQINKIGYIPNDYGKFYVLHTHELFGCRDSFRDSFIYHDLPRIRNIFDTMVCSPLLLLLKTKFLSQTTYLWNTTNTDTSELVTDTGIYWVKISNACGSITDTFKLRWKSPLLATPVFALDSLIVCGNNLPYTLTSQILGSSYRYLWSTGDTTNNLKLNTYSLFTVTVTDNCHTYRDSFKLIALKVASPPTHPDSVSLCATTYKITRPQNLRLEEKFGSLWLSKDSILLSKNEKKTFRWTDSCGTVTYDSIYDYQRGSFPLLPKSQKLCETFASLITNTQTTITQFEFVNSWQPNNTVNLQLGPNYIRRDDNCGNQQFDTILGFSTKQPKNIITEDSLVLCPQEFPYTLTVSDTFKTYLWSNGSMTNSSKLVTSNSYQLTASDACYSYTDSIEVKEITTPNEIALEEIYRELCKALEKTRVETKLTYPQYIWNQAASPLFYYTADTSKNLVTLYIPRRCDTLKDSIALYWLDPRLTPPLYTVDSSYCKQAEGAVKLTLTNRNDYQSYLWKGDSLPYIFVNTLGTTKFFAKNLCYEKYFDIPPYSCPLDPIGLPSAFSPNGDKLNDSWGLQGAKNIILHSLSIYNRWGEKIFETTNPNHAWDGSYKGEPTPLGSYQYYIDYEYTPQGIRKNHRGEVSVVR